MHSPADHSPNETYYQLPQAPHGTVELLPTPDSIPKVSFDSNLKDQINYIDFYTEAYGTYLRKRDLTDSQVANTSLQFDSRPKSIRPGYYDPYDEIAHVRISTWRSQRTLDRAVAHESEHHINQLSGLADKWRALIVTHNCSIFIGSPLALTGALLSHIESLDTPGKIIMGLGLAVSVVSQVAYYGNPDEISAHRAGRNAPTFVTMRR